MENIEVLKLTLEAIGFLFVTPIAVVVWFWMRKQTRDIEELKERDAQRAKDEAERAAAIEKAVVEKTSVIEKELSEFKLSVAKEYPSHEAFDKLADSFKQSMEALFRKLDRMEGDMRQMSNDFRDRLDGKQDKSA